MLNVIYDILFSFFFSVSQVTPLRVSADCDIIFSDVINLL